MNLSEELKWRGFVNQTTYPDISRLDGEPITFYWGVDPSAPSMTIGNLAAAMMVRQFIAHGHKAVLLIGGATGLIGDPDGKSEERNLKTPEEIAANKAAIIAQYQSLFDGMPFEIVDNYDWFKDINYLDFLRNVGKHVPMRQMLARDFVQSRLGEGGAGISYAEFSYALIQGYDFLHLYKEHGVSLQVCGSDQWGNSIAGVDLIRRVTGQEAHVWSTPLVVNKATGVKFGKSEDGAVWLDANLTSVFKFYQFWLNVDDDGVQDYLKVYTLLSKEEVVKILEEFQANPGGRAAQKSLAHEVTKIVHGQERADAAVQATEVLFGQSNFKDIGEKGSAVLRQEIPAVHFENNLSNTLVAAGLASSNSEATRFIQEGSVAVNNQKISPDNIDPFQPGPNLLKRGKNSFAIVDKN